LSPRVSRLLRPLLVLPWLLLVSAPALTAGEAELQRQAYLAAELAAAKSKAFYLVFDPGASALDLKIEGVRVHRFALERAEFGRSRFSGGGERRWPAVEYTLTTEIPEPERPRIEVQKQEDADKALDEAIQKAIARGKKPAGELPETAGEKVAKQSALADPDAPLQFVLEFDPGLVLVVRGEPAAAGFGDYMRRLGHSLVEGWEGLLLRFGGDQPAARIVAWLPPQDARRLQKALAPELKLLLYSPPAP
jgi:hypothetical protein